MNTPNKKILLVDNDFDTLNILSCHFKKNGYDVFISTSGEDGLNKAREFVPDIIITDIVMPGMNGLQMCKTLKKDNLLRNIPVLFLTANTDESLAVSAHYAGGDHYITKPVKPRLILEMAKELIEKIRSEKAECPAL